MSKGQMIRGLLEVLPYPKSFYDKKDEKVVFRMYQKYILDKKVKVFN